MPEVCSTWDSETETAEWLAAMQTAGNCNMMTAQMKRWMK